MSYQQKCYEKKLNKSLLFLLCTIHFSMSNANVKLKRKKEKLIFQVKLNIKNKIHSIKDKEKKIIKKKRDKQINNVGNMTKF